MATPPKKPAAPRKPPESDASPRKPAARKPAAPSASTASKPRASRAASTKANSSKPATKSRASSTAKKSGSHWGTAAIVGGVAAVGAAATAALLALRGNSPIDFDAILHPGDTAHQADGTDSSDSFNAGIADEGTIPEGHPS